MICGSCCDGGYVPRKIGLPASFTNYDMLKAPAAPAVCVACAWAMAGKPPDTLRMWSIVYLPGIGEAPCVHQGPDLGLHAIALRAGDLVHVLRLLCNPPSQPWGCAIADSGKLHVLPYARLNNGTRWTVRFEAVDVSSDASTFREVVAATAALLRAGYPRSHIAACDTNPAMLNKCGGVLIWHDNVLILKTKGRGGVGTLALFLLGQSARGANKKEIWNEW